MQQSASQIILEITHVDGTTHKLRVPEGVELGGLIQTLHVGAGFWTDDRRTFVPWNQIKLIVVAP